MGGTHGRFFQLTHLILCLYLELERCVCKQEEQARSGSLELVQYDATRPPPEDVMRSLSLELDYDNLLANLFAESTCRSCDINHPELNETSQPSIGSSDISNAAPVSGEYMVECSYLHMFPSSKR